ncbi:MAG: hypothetical protein CIT01_09525 [Methanobacterium sp. BRmetb2]|nr:MAG: hypothetical protein CIT01_09525 [Methanobacterium sp. BRmetb2]
MYKLSLFTVVFILTISLSICTAVAPLNTFLSPDNYDVIKYFNRIAELPYRGDVTTSKPKTPAQLWNLGYGDCDDKAVAFLDYLYNKGERKLFLVNLKHKSGKYSHACLIWNNRIYDPTIQPTIYNMDQKRYFDTLKDYRFTSHTEQPYKPL